MFREHGFDRVTVTEVARAAGVSAMTVFNYFPRKEDLFLDRIPEAVEAFAGAVRGRAADEPRSRRCAAWPSVSSTHGIRWAGWGGLRGLLDRRRRFFRRCWPPGAGGCGGVERALAWAWRTPEPPTRGWWRP